MHVKVWELIGRKFNVAKHVFYGTGNVDMYVMTDLNFQSENLIFVLQLLLFVVSFKTAQMIRFFEVMSCFPTDITTSK